MNESMTDPLLNIYKSALMQSLLKPKNVGKEYKNRPDYKKHTPKKERVKNGR